MRWDDLAERLQKKIKEIIKMFFIFYNIIKKDGNVIKI
tara:strand:+ start:1110 stop:1223 length:114 start_codon:yes stop_codon:yes gene_type:complete